MLSRVADSLYWMSRYLERAEHTARIVDVHLNIMLDISPDESNGNRWERLLDSLQIKHAHLSTIDAFNAVQLVTLDHTDPNSILSCITSARENARQVRDKISSEMWEQINRLYLLIKNSNMETIWASGRHDFYHGVKEGSHLFEGITDSTLSHEEGWQFIQLGRNLERSSSVASLLDVHFKQFLRVNEYNSEVKEYLEWVGLLKSCTAFEAYCKVHKTELRPDKIAEYLLLDKTFPHSIRFSSDVVRNSLQIISDMTNSQKSERLNKLAGRLSANLGFGQIDEILTDGIHQFLSDIQRNCTLIHTALFTTYVVYPIETELVK